MAGAASTSDSFQNFLFNLGVGTDNPTSASTYGFNPITRVHTLLEWIYRGSWIGGVAIDLVADDMTRAGIDLRSTLKPDDSEKLQGALMRLGVWNAVNDAIKWSRLYGGAIAVALIDGQDMSLPLNVQRIAKRQFKGLFAFDRWMVQPSLDNLVTDFGPDLGKPKYYRVATDAPALRGATIHYSRIIRLDGIKMPYWQKIAENMWGISVLERLYDRMIAFDSATQGASQLVYKSYLRFIKIKDFREAISAGPEAAAGITKYLDMMRRFQGIEGLTIIDAEDDFGAQTHAAFSGLSDALQQFGQQISGALQIPLVRLFGQSPAGLNSSGDSDLRTYYDGINQRQEADLRGPFDWLLQVTARSEGIVLPPNFNYKFASLWQMTPEQKASVAQVRSTAILAADAQGVIDAATTLKELREVGHDTGTFTNITDEQIEQAALMPVPDPFAEPGTGEEGLSAPGGVPGISPPAKPKAAPAGSPARPSMAPEGKQLPGEEERSGT